jgi:amidophosphoribosyltransferase
MSYSNKLREFSVVSDGYFRSGKKLREKYGGSNDSDLLARFIADADDFAKGIKNFLEETNYEESFCAIALSEKGEMYIARAPLGVQPLIYGKGERGHAVVSESRALFHIDMEIVRDINAGEILFLDSSGLYEIEKLPSNTHLCSFLFGYFSYPDSIIEGIPVEKVRKECGAILARKDKACGFKPDLVTPIPDSGKKYGEGYALEIGAPYSEILYKYPYKGRSYMRPGQEFRDIVAVKKITTLPKEFNEVNGKVLVLTEDSIRRGTQIIRKGGPIDLLKNSGAKEIHTRVGTPKNLAYCRFLPPDGNDYDDRSLAANRYPTNETLNNYLGVNSIDFIDLEDFKQVFSSKGLRDLCFGCYTGDFSFIEKFKKR